MLTAFLRLTPDAQIVGMICCTAAVCVFLAAMTR